MSAGRLIIILLLFFMFACQVEGESLVEPITYSLEDSLKSFSFLKADNSKLPSDVHATISGTIIQVDLPPDVTTDSLIASFTTKYTNAKVYIGSIEQVNHKTANNFASNITYRVVSEDGHGSSYRVEINPSFPEIDAALQTLMQRYSIPGLSVAITKNEKLVFAQSYGYANLEDNQLVDNLSLFRIASVSKPITSVAVLKLVQEGKISLEDKVFGRDGILKKDYPNPPSKSMIDEITVQDLLTHRSGWDNSPDDPMFCNVSRTRDQIISDMIKNRPLKYKPGTTYSYSNFGYCVLGRIIEKISGKSYTDYVQQEILQPAGVYDMQLAGSTPELHTLNEVKYYQSECSPYQYNLPRMDAHGGWIATATDLARFITQIDKNTTVPDLIDSSLLQNTYFDCETWSHYGSLPGTTAVMTKLNNEYSFIVLANTRNESYPYLIAEELNNTLKSKILSTEQWPEIDLFNNSLVAEIK